MCIELASEVGHPYTDLLQRIQCLLQDVSSAIATPNTSAREVEAAIHYSTILAFRKLYAIQGR